MKPFDINLAKQGHPVCTRDGRPARVICWDCKSSIGEDKTPIVALIQLSDGGEYPYCYYKNGLFTDRHTDKRDLMMASVKHEGWVIVFANGELTGQVVYKSKEDALKVIGDNEWCVAKIEWEE